MVTFLEDPVVIVEKVDGLQMGVTIQLGGMTNWLDYLDTEVENNDLDDDDAYDFERWYDGYQMLWAFDTTALLHTADGAIDAACISSSYAEGGFCAGIIFRGSNTRTPELWAQWSHQY